MSTRTMMFSSVEVHRCRIHILASCCGAFPIFPANDSSLRLLEGRVNWNQRLVTTKARGIKPANVIANVKCNNREVLSENHLAIANVMKTQPDLYQEIQFPDRKQETAECKDFFDLATVIGFDLETTGFSRVNDRIIEIALRDLRGGKNSTFQTLVNPQCHVPNSRVHGISTQMVKRTDVPRMQDLIPILLQYIQSRQKPGGDVLWVAHNARRFDVPFLACEFNRCSAEIPYNWWFLDTYPMAYERMRFPGTDLPRATLAALREFYKIKVDGLAHRAMVDVITLCQILPLLTSDLKLTLPSLVKKSFSTSDLMYLTKKSSV